MAVPEVKLDSRFIAFPINIFGLQVVKHVLLGSVDAALSISILICQHLSRCRLDQNQLPVAVNIIELPVSAFYFLLEKTPTQSSKKMKDQTRHVSTKTGLYQLKIYFHQFLRSYVISASRDS